MAKSVARNFQSVTLFDGLKELAKLNPGQNSPFLQSISTVLQALTTLKDRNVNKLLLVKLAPCSLVSLRTR